MLPGSARTREVLPYSIMRILIASGGSAGHLYPALSLAEVLKARSPDIEIAFVSSDRSGLTNAIKNKGYKFFLTSITSFSIKRALKAFYFFLKSFFESFFIIERFRPDIIVGFGSYVSFPVLLLGSFFKKTTIIHEQNVSLGLANKVLAFFVDRIATSFNQTCLYAVKGKFTYTGYPLRRDFFVMDKTKALDFFRLEDKFTILVLGGSQGSRKINSEFKETIEKLTPKIDFQVIHVTGKNDYSELKDAYKHVTIKNCIFDFFEPMHIAYSACDIVISRAGAGTVNELIYFEKPAILIPYPLARQHQLENACVLKNSRASIVIEEKDLSSSSLSVQIIKLFDNNILRSEMASNIRKLKTTDAAGALADLILADN